MTLLSLSLSESNGRSNITINVERLKPEDLDLERIAIKRSNYFEKILSKEVSSPEYSPPNLKLSNYNMYNFSYLLNHQSDQIRINEMGAIKDDKLYYIEYSSFLSSFDNYYNDFIKVIESINFTNTKREAKIPIGNYIIPYPFPSYGISFQMEYYDYNNPIDVRNAFGKEIEGFGLPNNLTLISVGISQTYFLKMEITTTILQDT